MNTTKQATHNITTTPTCDICGTPLNETQAYYLPTAEVINLPYFWMSTFIAQEEDDQCLPASREELLDLVISATQHDQGFKFCHECSQRICDDNMAVIESQTKQNACKLGQSFWVDDIAAPKLLGVHQDKFLEAYQLALNILGLYLVANANLTWENVEWVDAYRCEIIKKIAGHLEDLGFTLETDPETEEFALGE